MNKILGLSYYRALLGAAVSLAVFGCSKKQEFDSKKNQKIAIQDAFGIKNILGEGSADANVSVSNLPPAPSDSIKPDKAKLSIKKAALEKEFLLQAEVITQHPAPRFTGFQSRVVMFRQKESKVYLVESSRGQNQVKGMDQDLLLAEFPVTNEDDLQITIDFNSGMKNIFQITDWTSQDQSPEDPFVSSRVAFSYIDYARFSKTNNLVIKQVAQMQAPESVTFSVIYYLSPYATNPKFTPTVAPRNYDRYAFFEVAPIVNEESGTTIYASKQDISKPIVFAISANTPAEFKSTVKEGILYWNKAFGKEVVQAVDAPPGVNAPDADFNIVQWVDWDSAGMAYADAQMDPLTGEILHQQVYFTSAWAKIGRYHAQKLIRQVNNHEATTEKKKVLQIKGFRSSNLCELNMEEAVSADVLQTIIRDSDPVKVAKASQDLLREVVAHEVGHTLGLRHNFAGSNGVNYTLDSRLELFKKYLETGSAPEKLIPTTSVMDYNLYPEGMMVGDLIAKSPTAQEYDTKAIRTLFLGETYKNDEWPLFCTDSHVGQYLDCNRYDAGSSYIEWVKYDGHFNLSSLPRTILETFISAKNPLYGAKPIPVTEVPLYPKNYLASVLMSEARMLALAQKEMLLLKTARAFPVISGANISLARNKTLQYSASEIVRHGDLEKIFINAQAGLAKQLKKHFFELLSQPQNISGTGPNGKSFAFSSDEIAQMKIAASGFFDKFEEELILTEVSILAKVPNVKGIEISPISDLLLPYLARREKSYLMDTTGRVATFQKVMRTSSEWNLPPGSSAPKAEPDKRDVVTITLPEFAYDFEVRKIAATLLNSARTPNALWGLNEKLGLQRDFMEMVNKAIPAAAQNIKLTQANEYPQEMLQWLYEASAINSILQQ